MIERLNIFSTRDMVRESYRLGDIPDTAQAYKTLARIALPAVIEMMSIAFIGMTSTAMVGKMGPEAVAAVGLTGQPRMLFMAMIFALNVGVTAIISRRKGEGNQEAARTVLRQSISIALVMGIIMTALAIILSTPVMKLSGAKSDTIGPATLYFRISSASLVFSSLTSTICAAQRGVGNTRVTMVVNIAANIVNVTFHFLLIEGRFFFPRMGVAGAGTALALSAAAGAALAVTSLLKKGEYLRISRRDNWKLDPGIMNLIVKIGGNSVFEQICLRIGFLIYSRVIAELGTEAYAAHQIASQMMNISFTFADGLAVATTSLVGQYLGMKRSDLSILYGKVGQRVAFAVSIILMTVSFTTRFWFPTWFTEDAEVIRLAAGVILVLGFIQPFQTSSIVLAGSLRGAGDVRYVAITMLISVTFIRPALAYLLVFPLGVGLAGAWLAMLFDQGLRFFLVYFRFVRGKWMNIRI